MAGVTAGAAAPAVAGASAIAMSNMQSDLPTGPSGLSVDAATGELVFRTEPVELKSFEESYTCFAVTVDEDVVVDGFSKTAQRFVHHAQFVKALFPSQTESVTAPNAPLVCARPIQLR
jgi:hypothetical protein